MSEQGEKKGGDNFWKSPAAILCYLGVGYWIYTYHLEHALGLLPYAILLLCPLMHFFMMKNHGGCHHDHSHDEKSEDNKEGKNHAS